MRIEKPSRSYDFMDDYPRALTLQQFRAASGTKRESYNFKDGTIDQWMALGMIDPLRYPNTDWFDTFMRTGTLQTIRFQQPVETTSLIFTYLSV